MANIKEANREILKELEATGERLENVRAEIGLPLEYGRRVSVSRLSTIRLPGRDRVKSLANQAGGLAERFKAPVLKTGNGVTRS